MTSLVDIHSAKPLLSFSFIESIFPLILFIIGILICVIVSIKIGYNILDSIKPQLSARKQIEALQKKMDGLPNKQQAYLYTRLLQKLLAEAGEKNTQALTVTEMIDLCKQHYPDSIPLLISINPIKYSL